MSQPPHCLCTFPGKFGDLLWALPTVRAIAARLGAPVDLIIARDYWAIASLIAQQPYVDTCWASPLWVTQETAPISPRLPAWMDRPEYDHILHLGYRGWPLPDVVRHTAVSASISDSALMSHPIQETELGLDVPWITVPPPLVDQHSRSYPYLPVGFTEEHFELKVGLVTLLSTLAPGYGVLTMLTTPGSRWVKEYGGIGRVLVTDWVQAAQILLLAPVFLGDCSALHVLAVACGIPAVIMEPSVARHHPVFWPLGQTGPQVTLVRGGDGQPTFDARHVHDTLMTVLTQRSPQVPKETS
jgi:hypothetical protein